MGRSCTSGVATLPKNAEVDGQDLLLVMGHLLNSLVVEIMGGDSEGSSKVEERPSWMPARPSITRAMSDSALQTFCHLHHL